MSRGVVERGAGTTSAGGSASAGASARTAPSRRRQRAPDGYAPLPEWLGQTRASRAAKTAAYDVETVAEGFAAAFCFSFLPDGRIIVGERPGRIRIVGKDGKVSEPIDGMPGNLFVRGGQGLYEVRPDRAFAANRTIFLTYTVLPDDSNPGRCRAAPASSSRRARSCRRTTSGSRT
jgi:glucose/arabinose dehydrogenase